MKRTQISMILLSLLLLASCSDTDHSSADTTAPTAASDTTAVTEDLYEADNLPDDLDFGGQVIRIGLYDSDTQRYMVAPESEAGEILDDAVFQRNERVKERLNIDMELLPISCGWAEYRQKVLNAITANTGEYDAWYLWQYDFANTIVNNYWLDLQDAPYIDYSKPWWASDYMKEMSVDGSSTFFLMGDISYGFMNNADCVFFNKNLISSFNIEPNSIYQTVLEGNWTLGTLREIAKDLYIDVNGNSQVDLGDTVAFGVVNASAPPEHFIFAAGNRFSYRREDGYPVLDPINDKIVNTIDAVIDLYHNLPSVIFYNDPDYQVNNANWRDAFVQGNTVFHFEYLSYMKQWRDMENGYGVIPFPKYDETQETYLSLIHNVAYMYGIPTDCQNVDVTCAMMEALASDSHRSVMPVYYSQVLKEKYARDTMSGQIIDIIHDNPVADFAYIMDFGIHNTIRTICTNTGKNTYVSETEKSMKKIQKQLDKMIEAVEG